PSLKGHIQGHRDLLACYLPAENVAAMTTVISHLGGHTELSLDDTQREAANIPHVFEFCYNHTTLQVLKSDRSATYQQIGVPNPSDADAIDRLLHDLGADVWNHHEFFRLGGEVGAIDIPIIWYSGTERLEEINKIYQQHGFPVYDAHVNKVEGGGLHNADYAHLAWKKRLDPKGLLNSSKSIAWQNVKHLSPEQIEAKVVD
ncbi:MAG: FAD-binding oxidoreductase, partial [Rhizobiaceae bacterium]